MNKSILITLALVLLFNFVTSASHLRSKTQNTFASLRAIQTSCLQKQKGSYQWDFYKTDSIFVDGTTGYRTEDFHIDYEFPFCDSNTTSVIVHSDLAGFDLEHTKNLILFSEVDNVTTTGFDVRLTTYSDAIVYGALIRYNAYQIPDSAN